MSDASLTSRLLLVISDREDGHVRLFGPRLDAAGIRWRWIDADEIPAHATLSVATMPDGARSIRWRDSLGTLDCADVGAVWYRRWRQRGTFRDGFPAYAERNGSSLVSVAANGLFELLDVPWLPARPRQCERAALKVAQLDAAVRAGFRVPHTVVTNDPDDAVAAWEAMGGRAVVKWLARPQLAGPDGSNNLFYTHVLTRRDLLRLDALADGPLLFQAYVPKRAELRVTVIGSAVFAASIDSQSSRVTRHDWRHYDENLATFTAHKLPAKVAAACRSVLRSLGLAFGAVDLILQPDGEYVFLECNPNGQWLFVEQQTGQRLSAAMVRWFARKLARGAAATRR